MPGAGGIGIGIGDVVNSKEIHIGIGIGNFRVINSENNRSVGKNQRGVFSESRENAL